MFPGLFVLAVIVTGLYWYLTTTFNYWRAKNVPHKKPLPVLGGFLDIIFGKESPGLYFADLYNNCNGPYYGSFTMDKPFLLLKELDIIKNVMVKDFSAFPNRFFYNDGKGESALVNVLFGIKNPQWSTLRKKLSPAFTTSKIKMMVPLITECADNMINYLNAEKSTTINTKDLAAKFTTDVIATCAFGIKANSFSAEGGAFGFVNGNIFKDSLSRSIQPLAYIFAHKLVQLLRFEFIGRKAESFFKKVFFESLKQREVTNSKRNDFIDILIEIRNKETKDDDFKLDNDRIASQAIIFFAAGNDTTSSTIAFSLYELALNQNIQDRLREEIKHAANKYGGLTYEGITSMKYLNAVVLETLRKYPVAPFIQRQCEENYLFEETGLEIDPGVRILISIYGLHWDPNYFPEPQNYDPDRFSDERISTITPFSYLPFGEGPRGCIGKKFGVLNTKIGLIYVIKNFIVKPNSLTESPLIFGKALLLQLVGGIPLTYIRIED